MAQTMQSLHAILNSMTKVKLSISMIPSTHPSNKGFPSKGCGVIMRLSIYRDLFIHTHAVSRAHYMYIDHQAVDIWNRAKHTLFTLVNKVNRQGSPGMVGLQQRNPQSYLPITRMRLLSTCF